MVISVLSALHVMTASATLMHLFLTANGVKCLSELPKIY